MLDKDQAQKYLDNGAQPSSRVVRILKEQGIKLPKWVKEAPKKAVKAKHADKLRKNQPKEEPAVSDEAKSDDASSAPVAE